MGSLRDPGRSQMEAEELARAQLSASQTKRQASARRSRERRLKGSPAARKALAQDYAPVSQKERFRADRS